MLVLVLPVNSCGMQSSFAVCWPLVVAGCLGPSRAAPALATVSGCRDSEESKLRTGHSNTSYIHTRSVLDESTFLSASCHVLDGRSFKVQPRLHDGVARTRFPITDFWTFCMRPDRSPISSPTVEGPWAQGPTHPLKSHSTADVEGKTRPSEPKTML